MSYATDGLIRKLSAIGQLSDADREVLRHLPLRIVNISRDDETAADGDITSQSCLVVSGFMHRYKLLPTGGRQILSFHPKGDIPDLQSLHLKKMDHTLAATTDCVVGFVQHADLKDAIDRSPALRDLLWRDTLIDAAAFRTWMLMMGRANAEARMAHLFCEIFVRLEATGSIRGQPFEFPVTQVDLGDALGISGVHANRTIQSLRGAGLLEFENGEATILEWDRMRTLGLFDPAYLHYRDNSQGQ